MVANVIEKVALVISRGHRLSVTLDLHVIGQLERRLDNHPERTIATDDAVENICVLSWARLDDRTVGQHNLQRPHRKNYWTKSDVTSVRVHRERSTHSEVRITLHDLDSEVGRIDPLLHLPPTRSRLHRHGVIRGRKGQ